MMRPGPVGMPPGNVASIEISDPALVEKLGDAALVGHWFVFLKADWLRRSEMDTLLATAGIEQVNAKPAILFRGKESITLPGARISPTSLPRPTLVSLTSDKALYRANRDTVRLLIAAPQQPHAENRLALRLSGNPYASYPLTLDEYGLCLWSMQGLPEGEYEARLEESEADVCRFEVAEYRLAPLHAELVEQQLSGDRLDYALSVSAFGQPYSGPIEVELQERGRRIGKRLRLTCNQEGLCRGAVKLAGEGPYTLSVFVAERTATVALKGSEQQRRETLTISELGEVQELSLLPLSQAGECRGMYVSSTAGNNQPFLVRQVIGNEVEITPRVESEMLRVVMVDPARGSSDETLYEHLKAEQSIRLPVPSPYGAVLLGAFIDGKAWEGWCAVLRPPELRLQCEAPKEARPGARISVTLRTGAAERVVPVQLIVKDQRLVAPSDPQVELAACIKKNLGKWREQSFTGEVHSLLSEQSRYWPGRMYARATMPFPAGGPIVYQAMAAPPSVMMPQASVAREDTGTLAALKAVSSYAGWPTSRSPAATAPAQTALLANMRLQFPEIVYNNIVLVQGEATIEVRLGDSMTRYSIEAFALSSATLDWQRAETALDTLLPVYGELTVSPFVFAADPVLGRLDIGAASGEALVEVRNDGDVLPLFLDERGTLRELAPGEHVPGGSLIRFPLQPGAITATVRDARTGEVDVSERYVTEPGKLRHIMRRVRLLTPGDEVSLQEEQQTRAKSGPYIEIKLMPGLERPFQFFVEGAASYPFG